MRKVTISIFVFISILALVWFSAGQQIRYPFYISLTDLIDTSDTTPTDEQLLKYVSSTGLWTPASGISITSITLSNTGLHILDTNASHDLIFKPGSDLTADRTITFTTGDASRLFSLGANLGITGDSVINQDVSTVATPTFVALRVADSDSSNTLAIDWSENDSSNRNLFLKVNSANRTIDLSGDLTLSGANKVAGWEITGNLQNTGAALTIQSGADQNVTVFGSAASGETPSFTVSGYKSADSLRVFSLAVGSVANDTATITGLSYYTFDGAVTVTGLTLSDEISQTITDSADSYHAPYTLEWTPTSAMAAGGSQGIYSICNPVKDVQNAYSLRGRMDLRDASATVDVNQLHAVDALINFNTSHVYDLVDNISVIGAAVHGAGADITNTGGGGNLNLFYGVWGPTATQDFTAETNGMLLMSHAGTYLDYGVQVQNSGAMTAGLYLLNHPSNSPATMTSGILMESAASKMTYGINMSGASIATADIILQNGEIIDNLIDGVVNISGGVSVRTVAADTDNALLIKVAKVTKAHDADLFDASALTDSATIWQQPANSVLLSAKYVLDAQFTGVTTLDVDMGLAGDNDGLINAGADLVGDTEGDEFSIRGAYWSASTAAGYHAASATDWIAYATSTVENLDQTSAGAITFYFAYIQF